MNHFFQENFITIIVFLLLIIFVLMGAMIFVLFKLLYKKDVSPKTLTTAKSKGVKPEIPKPMASDNVVESFYCIHHQETPSVGACLICEEVFCDECLIDHDSMHFCKEHFRIFAGNKWKQITDVKTTPHSPEEGLFIYNFKRDIWKKRNIPTFVMTHYKINIENDYIESFIQLNVREEDVEKLEIEIQKYKA